MALFVNSGIYGDGDLYHSDSQDPRGYVGNDERHLHHISVALHYTALLVPGAAEAFQLLRMALRLAPDSQQSFTHEAFVDRVEATGHISARIRHLESELVLSHVQLTAQRKKHQPKG